MARPQVIQQLRHDKFLCKAVFPAFVDSWNYVANRVENLKGDSDINPQYGQGHITVDNSDPEHPIIRFIGGGSSISSDTSSTISVDSDGTSGQKSISYNNSDELQLYGMDSGGTSLPKKTIAMSADGYTQLLPNAYEFVLRHNGAGGEITYANLSCCIPNLSSLTPISGDANVIPNVQKTIATGVDLHGNTWHQLYNLGSTGVISATLAYDGNDHYIMNAGSASSNDHKQFLYYDLDDKCLKYADICLTMPKVAVADLDDDVIPEISSVVVPEISGLLSDAISSELSALDDKYWMQGEDESKNYGSAIGDNYGNIAFDLDGRVLYNNQGWAIDLNNRQFGGIIDQSWTFPNIEATRNIHAGNNINADVKVAAPQIHATGTGAAIKIGGTTLNETQLQQLLALLTAPQRLQNL